MENFTRYKFNEDRTITSTATGEAIALQKLPSGLEFYRLTNDSGERKRVYKSQITFPAPVAPEPQQKAGKGGRKGKLDAAQAKSIRTALAAGMKVADLAKTYNVNKSAIYDIKSGRLHNDGSIVYTGKR